MRFAVRGGFEGLLDGEPWAGRLLVSAELAALILEGDSEMPLPLPSPSVVNSSTGADTDGESASAVDCNVLAIACESGSGVLTGRAMVHWEM